MSVNISPYEISIWEDKLINEPIPIVEYKITNDVIINDEKTYFIYDENTRDYIEVENPIIENLHKYYECYDKIPNAEEIEYINKNQGTYNEATNSIEVSYYKENKIAIIGSDTLTAPNSAYNVIFRKNKNGEKELNFSLKYKYYDSILEDEVINPFVGYLINERKVKLYYNEKWYDFIIKEHNENKENYEWTYTAVDAFVNELSKNGYGITFNSELNNNQGTAVELALKTLEDTDWEVISIDLEPPRVNEPIYEAEVQIDLQAYSLDNNSLESIPVGTKIFIFYSYIANQNGKFLQFIKRTVDDVYEIDDNNNIIALNYRLDKDVVFKDGVIAYEDNLNTSIITYTDIYTKAQAYRTIFNQLTTYDPVMERTVDQYKAGEEIVYHYSDFTYTTSDVVVSYLTNGDNFNVYDKGDLQGWSQYASSNVAYNPKLRLTTYPEIKPEEELIPFDQLHQIEGYIEVQFMRSGNQGKAGSYLFNSGIDDHAYSINTISKGEQFLLRWRAGSSRNQHGPLNYDGMAGSFGAIVAPYTRELIYDSERKTSYYQNIFDESNVILHFDSADRPINNKLNNIISGGKLDEQYKNYWVDEVIQAPSTRYLYESEDPITSQVNLYKYDATSQEYVLYNPQTHNFMDYYYLIATAQQSVTRETLTDPKTRIGIFIYTSDSEPWYYIQDIQLTRYYKDANGKPVIMGNIPTATSTETDYYYVAPKVGSAAEKVKTYTSLEVLANSLHMSVEEIVPIYNNDEVQFIDSNSAVFYVNQTTGYDLIEQFHVHGYALEKILSIDASKSNCFDILQTIAETFECWIDLDVTHDPNGAIALNRFGKPTKQVYLRGYSGKDNFVGFKNNINLNTIERNVDSTEIVTKLIVEDVQNDYVDSGITSIQYANSNVSKEPYIYNFDYYFNQGLIPETDREKCEQDIYKFNEEVRVINIQLQEKEALRSQLENSLAHIEASRNVYFNLVDEAETQLNISLGDFQNITGYTYDEYQKISPDKIAESLNTELAKIDTINEIIGEIYTCSAVINNYQGYVTNLDIEHKKLSLELNGTEEYTITISRIKEPITDEWMVRVIVSDFISSFSFDLAGLTFKTDVNTRVFDQITDYTLINNFKFSSEYKLVDEDDNEITEVVADPFRVIKLRLIPKNVVKGVTADIDELLENKKKIVKDFNKKYSRFIQEGTWSSNEYISDDLYYLDALQLSRVSGQPKITYNITALDVSSIEEFESYRFDAGEQTFIEDTDFFGWNMINVGTKDVPEYIKTPIHEEVIVSEVEWHLDDPTSNNITIQNYKTRFEDLFQRIQATVQTVQYNEATYVKTSSIVDKDGSLKEGLLVDALNNITNRQYQLTTDGSVMVEGDNIIVRNLKNPLQMVRIASEGFSTTSDGGISWQLALSGRGLNANTVYAGSIDTDTIFIGGRSNPSFRWDSNGLSAYEKITPNYIKTTDQVVDNSKRYYILDNEQNYVSVLFPNNNGLSSYYEIENPRLYNFRNFVRFDQYGLYGIDLTKLDDSTTEYVAHSLKEVEDNAQFAVTWNGFFIRNSYPGGGRVSISSDNDFRIITNKNQEEKEKIKIGALEWKQAGWKKGDPIYTNIKEVPDDIKALGPSLYGIRIKNDNGEEVFKTDDDGNIVMTGTITAREGDFKGKIYVGNPIGTNILIDGGYIDNEGYVNLPIIESTNYDDGAGHGWHIDANGDAVFNNITARGAIKTAVFEYSEIQAVGGVFLFRPSSTIDSAIVDGDDIKITVKHPELFSAYDYCKVSSYTKELEAADVEENLQTNGLTYVYEIRKEGDIIWLKQAKPMVEGETAICHVENLIGGALVNMGNVSSTSNYGIGVNSSDNSVNLPARAISLFETKIEPNNDVKVSYDYKAVFGTLPELTYNGSNPKVSQLYQDYMRGTQGVFTDNMYIGDNSQYMIFYTDKTPEKNRHLHIQSANLVLNDDGAFLKGEIQALSGKIGGIDIEQNKLYTQEAYIKVFDIGRGYVYKKTGETTPSSVVTNPDIHYIHTYYVSDVNDVANNPPIYRPLFIDNVFQREAYIRQGNNYVPYSGEVIITLEGAAGEERLTKESAELVASLYEKVEYVPFDYNKFPYYDSRLAIPFINGFYIGVDTLIKDIDLSDGKPAGSQAPVVEDKYNIIAGGPITFMRLGAKEQEYKLKARTSPMWWFRSDGSARIGSLLLSSDGQMDLPSLSTITVDLGVLDNGIIKHDTAGFAGGLWISTKNLEPEYIIDVGGTHHREDAEEHNGVSIADSFYYWDWRLIMSDNFGVTSGGTMYSNGAKLKDLQLLLPAADTSESVDAQLINKIRGFNLSNTIKAETQVNGNETYKRTYLDVKGLFSSLTLSKTIDLIIPIVEESWVFDEETGLYSQDIVVNGMKQDYTVILVPDSSIKSLYSIVRMRCAGQETDKLKFTCKKIPTIEMLVHAVIFS